MGMTSAWWTMRSMSAAVDAALGKMLGQSLNARLVVRTMLLFPLVASSTQALAPQYWLRPDRAKIL
jgi:hypothetical protein